MTNELSSAEVKFLYDHALSVYRSGNWAYATQLLERLAGTGNPFHSAFALTLLADTYRITGKTEKELQTYSRIVHLPEEQKVLLDPRNLATCCLKARNFPEAKSWYRKILELMPNDLNAVAGLAELSLLTGENDEAITLSDMLTQRPEPRHQIVGRLLKGLGLALAGRQTDSAKELSWLGQYIISLGNVPADLSWDFRETQELATRMPDAKMVNLLIDVLSRRIAPADFARAFAGNVAVPG